MNDRPVKRSLTLKGHRTSVSLEDDFWQAFQDIARAEGIAINALASKVDAERDLETGLATAIRLFVFRKIRDARSNEGSN